MRPPIRVVSLSLFLLPLLGCTSLHSESLPSSRALVVGIDRYDGPGSDQSVLAERGLRNLEGAVRDAETMAAELEQRGYAVRLLRNGEATRAGLLAALEGHLERKTRRGDDLVFYFAGHGSRLDTGDPEEPDGRDETLVPADAGAGVADLLDDEMRRRLWRLLDRGARLTVILDACYSGSGVRGLPTAGVRAAKSATAETPAKQPRQPQPPPLENGDALILAAAQDSQPAQEIIDAEYQVRGAFTYALLRALGAAAKGESAATTFRRIASRMSADGLEQHPVFSGTAERQRQPLLSPQAPTRSPSANTTHAIVLSDEQGRVAVEGGWTRGLRVGDELEADASTIRLIDVDPVRSRGRRLSGPALEVGTPLERVRPGPLAEADLRVFMPEAPLEPSDLLELGRRIGALADERGAGLVTDPWRDAPTHVLRFAGGAWQLADRSGSAWRLGPPSKGKPPRLDKLPPGARLFVQLPLPRGAAEHIELGAGSRHDAIEVVDSPGAAHYQLVGRRTAEGLVYAWARAGVDASDAGESPLPTHTRDIVFAGTKSPTPEHSMLDAEFAAEELVELARKLARLRFWLRLESPKEDYFGYRLALLNGGRRTTASARPPELKLGESLGGALWSDQPFEVDPRYLYLLLLDSHGRQTLLYPHPLYGSVENRYPLDNQLSQPLIPFGPRPLLHVTEPVGLDTYILLTTNEPIPDPMVLDHSGVRAPRKDDHPLARLILESQRSRRSGAAMPTQWSIDRLTVRANE